ncbi:MAG TPA: hypothetical protein VFZ44_11115 [Pyrinomonadaceae bacterium]
MPFRKLLLLALSFVCLQLLCADVRAQAGDRAQAAAEIESLREQIKLREAALLAVTDEDRKAHAEFLAQPDTGLVRLLPREKWDSKLSTRGDGAYYSFARLTHEYGYGSDIQLSRDQLSVGFAGADFGFMVSLGDVPIENVSDETEAVQFMASFKTPEAEPEARKAHRQFADHEGHPAGRWTYRSRLPAVAGHTYALRSIGYATSDTLVAFHVVRKDEDGSVVLLWKMLKKYPKPTLRQATAVAAGQ